MIRFSRRNRCYCLVIISLTCRAWATPIESALWADYDGIVGDGSKEQTISSAGVLVQELQNAAQTYLFFSQTLANQIYYEVGAWGAYNYTAQNPLFTTVPVSNLNNPPGYGASAFVGYNFHTTDVLEITPYLRLNYFKNMTIVYADSNGNYINSLALAGFAGTKLAFKVTKIFTPVFNFWLGFQQISLGGDLQQGAVTNFYRTATVDQIVANTQVGFAIKVAAGASFTPFWQYQTAANYPDSVASTSPTNGGFGISSLTNSQQLIGIRYTQAW